MYWEHGLVKSMAMRMAAHRNDECEGPRSKNSSVLILRAQSAAARH